MEFYGKSTTCGSSQMFEGKERRLELINELRSTHALQTAERQIMKQEKNKVQNAHSIIQILIP